MRVIEPGHEIVFMPQPEEILWLLELAGRTCYKSEDKITEDSAAGFVGRIVRSGHESVIEHANVTVRFIVDRGVSHELVRHRLAAYSQESTRYANYSQERFGREITVIKPCFWEKEARNMSCGRRPWARPKSPICSFWIRGPARSRPDLCCPTA